MQHLVEIFRAVRRVLRDDGTVWVNYGDAYSGGGRGGNPDDSPHQKQRTNHGSLTVRNDRHNPAKPKDLLGLPWMLAYALRNDGWYLRSAIVWAKGVSFCDDYSGSVMPESVNGWRWERHRTKTGKRLDADFRSERSLDHQAEPDPDSEPVGNKVAQYQPCPGCEKCCDGHGPDGYVLRQGSWRPTSAYEHVFMLAKSDKYFCNAEAVREQGECPAGGHRGKGSENRPEETNGYANKVMGDREYSGTRNPRDVWTIGGKHYRLRQDLDPETRAHVINELQERDLL